MVLLGYPNGEAGFLVGEMHFPSRIQGFGNRLESWCDNLAGEIETIKLPLHPT